MHIRYRRVATSDFEVLLGQNHLSTATFCNELFDPDFFKRYTFPDRLSKYKAGKLNDFFEEYEIYGIPIQQMALAEMKLGNKSVFRGSLQSIIGKMTFFPIFNISHHENQLLSNKDEMIIHCEEECSGMVMSAFGYCTDFNSELFNVQTQKLTINDRIYELITGFVYNGNELRFLKPDAVVTGRRVYANLI